MSSTIEVNLVSRDGREVKHVLSLRPGATAKDLIKAAKRADPSLLKNEEFVVRRMDPPADGPSLFRDDEVWLYSVCTCPCCLHSYDED